MVSATRPAFAASAETPAALIDRLRGTLCAVEAATGLIGEVPLAFGVPAIDRALGGGLSCGTLHEISAVRETQIASATGFVLALVTRGLRCGRERVSFELAQTMSRAPVVAGLDTASRVYPTCGAWRNSCATQASPSCGAIHHHRKKLDSRVKPGGDKGNGHHWKFSPGRYVVWIAEDLSLAENGMPYGPGLTEAGIVPERLIMVAAARRREVLWGMEEALRCRAVGVVIGEMRARSISPVATRRLSLAAMAGNTLGLLLRAAPDDEPSAAATRWVIGAAPPAPFLLPPERGGERRSVGPPRLIARLTRNRRGHLGTWIVEWNCVEQRFELATHSEPVAEAAFDRPHRTAMA